MKKLIIALAAVAAVFGPSVVHADKRYKPQAESSTLCHTFSGAPKISISKEGNILLFQGADSGDHIYREGYVLCSTGSPARVSTNLLEIGFNPATCSCSSATNCTVTRTTSDGRMRLTQTFKKATDSNRSFDITMKVQNISGVNISGVILRRAVTIDINSAISEWHDGPRDSSSGWGTKDSGLPFAVRLRHITRNPTSTTYVAKTPGFDDNSCSPPDFASGGPVFGDYDNTIEYNLSSIAPSATKSVSVQYLRD